MIIPPLPHRLLLPPGEERAFRLQADYFLGPIDLSAFCATFPSHSVLGSNPLVLEPQEGSFVYLTRFGGVVFWNCQDSLIQQIHEELKSLQGLNQLEERARDTLKVRVGTAEDGVGFSEVRIKEFTLEKLGIVSLTLAQSVALDHFEDAVTQAMARFQPVVRALRQDGRMLLPHQEVLRIIGFALEVRAVVLDSLTLFDDPPETWESESLAHLDSALFGQFDLAERLGAIREKLGYLQDAGATLLGLLDTRSSRKLEWVIILLIFIELVLLIGKDVAPAVIRYLR
jgi:uncharacterized Rmd1/YagE family protein